MGAGNMGGPAGRELTRRMRSGQQGREDDTFQFGAGNETSPMGAPPAFGEEADLSEPGAGSPDPDAFRAVAGANRRKQARRGEERQAKFMAFKNDESMPGAGAGAPRMQPEESIGSDVGFDFGAMMGGPKQQFEEEVQARQAVPGQSLQAGQQAAQIRESLTARRGAAGKRRMPTMDDEYLSL